MQDPLNPLRGLEHDDFTGASLEAENGKITFNRLHTPNFEAAFISQTGRLILLFPDGHRQHLEHNDVKSLTQFLNEHVKVQPKPATKNH
jgi:ribosomal protein S18